MRDQQILRTLYDRGLLKGLVACIPGDLEPRRTNTMREIRRLRRLGVRFDPHIERSKETADTVVFFEHLNYLPQQNVGGMIADIHQWMSKTSKAYLVVEKQSFPENAQKMIVGIGAYPFHSTQLEDPIVHEDSDSIVYEEGLFSADFKCSRCGGCCRDCSGGYQFSPTIRDVLRWKAYRPEIMAYVERISKNMYEAWIDPWTHDDMNYCPWLRKRRGKNEYYCRIEDVKPDHCRAWDSVTFCKVKQV